MAFRIARQLGKGAQTLHNWSERAASRPKILAVGFGLFCTVVTWTPTVLAPLTGLDPSWNFGLAYSEVHHLAWGPGLDFTYGPLGFLTVRTLYFGSQAALAFAYLFFVQLALFTLLFRFTRKELPLWIAALVSYIIGATAIFLIDPGDLIMAPTFLVGIMAIRQQDEKSRRFLLAALSAIAAAGLFIKFTDGALAQESWSSSSPSDGEDAGLRCRDLGPDLPLGPGCRVARAPAIGLETFPPTSDTAPPSLAATQARRAGGVPALSGGRGPHSFSWPFWHFSVLRSAGRS